MKKMKEVLAMILSLAMTLAMSITAFAAPVPTDTTAYVVVKNVSVSNAAVVKAYQIVTYDEKGEYKLVEGINTVAPTMQIVSNGQTSTGDPAWEPAASDILAIAKSIADRDNEVIKYAGTSDFELQENGDYRSTNKVAAGMWIVLIKGGSDTVYNPMLVSVQVQPDGTVKGGEVDANGNYFVTGYAKHSDPTMDKKITGSTTPVNGAATDNTDDTLVNQAKNNGNDVAIGDTVSFEITAQIPAYTEAYKEVKVTITDQLSEGLSLNSVPVVKLSGEESSSVAGRDYTYTEGTPENGYTIALNSDYALAHSGQTITVTYTALLTNEAGTNYDPNTNTATFTYTNNPSNVNDTKTLDDKTYTYTFEIDGELGGENSGEWSKVTEELLKGTKVTTTENGKWKEYSPLKDAEFKLTNNETGKVYTATSDENGRMNFKGLDAGEYTLVETKAPAGYTIDEREIPVVITATYKEDGRLEKYEIKVNNKNTSTYTATYNTSNKDIVDDVNITSTEETTTEHISDSYIFWNTKLTELPSTGGIGTTIFTIGGCIIMIVAAGLFFASRRKKAEN